MHEAAEEPILVLAQGQVGRWQAEVVMMPDQQGAAIQLATDDKVEQCLAFNASDLGRVLVSIIVTGAHLGARVDGVEGPYTGIDRRILPATGCMLLSIALLNDAGVPIGIALQLGWIEDSVIEPFSDTADNLTLAKADVPALVELARAAATDIDRSTGLARLVVEPSAGCA